MKIFTDSGSIRLKPFPMMTNSPAVHHIPLINRTIAHRLKEVADLLHNQESHRFRVLAYQRAAQTLEQMEQPVDALFQAEGLEGLKRLPGIGESLGRALRELILRGKLPMLDRLRGEAEPVSLLATIPGIGKKLANHLHHDLEIDTLEELEIAAHDGRLTRSAGIGKKRLASILACVTERLERANRQAPRLETEEIPIEELLDVDHEYREKANAGALPVFAPRRLNPTHKAWLPILHTQRGNRHYTAFFSNTPRAHKKGKTHDWVVLFIDDGQRESQCTIITAEWGILEGCRIVRGREAECLRYYERQNVQEQQSFQDKFF